MSIETFHDDVRSAFRQVLVDWQAANPQAPQALDLENEAFSPELSVPYLRERQVASYSRATALGVQEHGILCLATLFRPAGEGTQIVGRFAGSLLARFKVGTKLEYGASAVRVTAAERKAHIVEPSWVSVPVIITVMGHTLG